MNMVARLEESLDEELGHLDEAQNLYTNGDLEEMKNEFSVFCNMFTKIKIS